MAKKTAKRRAISRRLRFEVFKRDQFLCQYCGRRPPAVVLEIDHVKPVCKGGSNAEHNLITACFDCNRGKATGTLVSSVPNVADRAKMLKERLEQAKAYDDLLQEQRDIEEWNIEEVAAVFEDSFEGWHLTDTAKNSIRLFLRKLPRLEVIEAMESACRRMERKHAFKYFCGICWKIIKADGR